MEHSNTCVADGMKCLESENTLIAKLKKTKIKFKVDKKTYLGLPC